MSTTEGQNFAAQKNAPAAPETSGRSDGTALPPDTKTPQGEAAALATPAKKTPVPREKFTLPEKRLPHVLGITRDELRDLRQKHLVEGVDWILDKRILLTEDALAKLREIMKTGPLPAASTLPPVEELVIWRANVKNSHVILCYKEGTDPAKNPADLLTVSVRDNKNFVERGRDGKPMKVPARKIHETIYELAGWCPRFRGGPAIPEN